MEETDDFLAYGEKRDTFDENTSSNNINNNNSRRKSSIFRIGIGNRRRLSRRRTTIFSNYEEYSFAIYDELVEICQDNRQYFESDDSESGHQFHEQFELILNNIASARQYVKEFNGFVCEYDFDERTPGNGYRSLVKAMHSAIEYCIRICSYIAKNRRYLLFRKSVYIKEIEACNGLLSSLCCGFGEALKTKMKCERGQLIPRGEHKAIGLFNMSEAINQISFYGRCIGFQYCDSIQPFAKLICIAITGLSEMYYNKSGNHFLKATSSLFSSSKYYRNPEMRAKRFLELSLYAGIDFSKSFLSLTERELLHTVSYMLFKNVKINKIITIPPERIELENVNKPNKMVEIPIPSSHLGIGPVSARLLSHLRREGMLGEENKIHTHPVAKSLIFHCHGGGFVAQSSKSHEVYLREWATELQVPILSIDYSLAPQAPYPRALEEIYYAYCWAIKNAKLLGTSAEQIIVVGDSAGATLNMALTLKCIEQSVRKPDGVCIIYSPLAVGFDPTPSRVLSSMDIMLPHGFLMGYLKAYVHPGKDQYFVKPSERRKMSKQLSKLDESMVSAAAAATQNSIDNNNLPHSTKHRMSLSTDRNPADDYLFDIPRDPFLSPLYASDEMLIQFPPIKIVAVDNDPLLDESVTMAKRLKSLGRTVGLDVLPGKFAMAFNTNKIQVLEGENAQNSLCFSGLPHGFLHFLQVSKDANEGNRLCVLRLAELIGTKVSPKYRNSIFA